MRLLFAYGVLLLALCRSSCGELLFWGHVEGFARQNWGNESTFFIPPDVYEESFGKIVLGNATRFLSFRWLSLNQILGNTMYAMIWHQLGLYETLPAYYKSALDNGVLCETQITNRDETIIHIQYQAEALTEEQKSREDEAAKELGFCEKDSHVDIYSHSCQRCRRRNVLLYCMAMEMKLTIMKARVAKKTCSQDILDALMTEPKTDSNREIFSYYFTDDITKFDRLFNNRDPELESQSMGHPPSRYCMTTEPESHATVRAIFAADALRWTLEGIAMQTVFKGAHKDLDSACAVDAFKSSEVGKCACTIDTGIAFCVQRTRAEYYKKIGYLNCTVEAKFEESNKPAIIPPFICYSDSVAAAKSAECADYRKAMN